MLCTCFSTVPSATQIFRAIPAFERPSAISARTSRSRALSTPAAPASPSCAQPWLRVFWLPAYAPDLNPGRGIWPVLERGGLANLAVASFAHLVQVIRHGLKKIQYQPGLIEGCLAGTGLALDPD